MDVFTRRENGSRESRRVVALACQKGQEWRPIIIWLENKLILSVFAQIVGISLVYQCSFFLSYFVAVLTPKLDVMHAISSEEWLINH